MNIFKNILFVVVLLLSACGEKAKVYTPRENTQYRYNQIDAVKQPETVSIINPKTGLLRNNEFRVALMLPLSGDKQEIGRHVMDAVMMAIQDIKENNIKLFVFDTADDEVKAQYAAKQAISLDVRVILGPIFTNETQAIKRVIEPFGIPIISLSNNNKLASASTFMFGISPNNLMRASFEYLKQKNRKHLGLLLPGTKGGFITAKYFNDISRDFKFSIMKTEYYSIGNQESIGKTVSKLYNHKSLYYLIDKDGNEYLEKLGTKKDKEKEKDLKKPEKKLVHMDVLYIEATGHDLYKIIAELKRNGFLDSNMMVMSSQNILEDQSVLQNPSADGIFIVNTATPYIYDFNENFYNLFNYHPLRLAAMAYDACATVITISKNQGGEKFLDILTQQDGFTGVYGDFRFRRDGIVERSYYVQKINKKSIELVGKIDKFV